MLATVVDCEYDQKRGNEYSPYIFAYLPDKFRYKLGTFFACMGSMIFASLRKGSNVVTPVPKKSMLLDEDEGVDSMT